MVPLFINRQQKQNNDNKFLLDVVATKCSEHEACSLWVKTLGVKDYHQTETFFSPNSFEGLKENVKGNSFLIIIFNIVIFLVRVSPDIYSLIY